MSDELALRKDAERAARAQALIDDELLGEAFARLESDYIAGWRDTPARDTDARERFWQAVQIVGKVRTHLQTVLNDGALARRELSDIEQA